MTNNEYLAALKRQLKPLPKEERDEALKYYAEYLEEGSVEELGDVRETARQILDQCAIKSLDGKSKGSGVKTLWLVILAVFAAPLALPVAIALGTVMLAILITVFAVILAIIISVAAFILAGILLTCLSAVMLHAAPVNFIMTLGIGLIIAGAGLLVLIGSVYLTRGIAGLLARLFGKLLKRGAANE